jgi:N-6 DNA Methylase
VFERLGPNARPEEVLDLKVCDPAMGSGAFLVEACRALAARLVQAWAGWPETRPKLPPDEDEDLHARRLVAQRCLYGVDKNPMATDLAKLSLWLATLARDHEFTFLDHALKSGDSLAGLARDRIGAVHWDSSKPGLPLFRTLIGERFEAALAGRAEIRDAPDDVERAIQESRYQRIERRVSDARQLGDAVMAAFFSADRPRARETKRQEIESWLNEPPEVMWNKVSGLAGTLRLGERSMPPFHWELEFPEVFGGDNPGFDVIIGTRPIWVSLDWRTRLGPDTPIG